MQTEAGRHRGFGETEVERYIDKEDYREGLVDSKWDMCDEYGVEPINRNRVMMT